MAHNSKRLAGRNLKLPANVNSRTKTATVPLLPAVAVILRLRGMNELPSVIVRHCWLMPIVEVH